MVKITFECSICKQKIAHNGVFSYWLPLQDHLKLEHKEHFTLAYEEKQNFLKELEALCKKYPYKSEAYKRYFVKVSNTPDVKTKKKECPQGTFN